jgi:organic hydroperoxide reductase OsmC/OhrA
VADKRHTYSIRVDWTGNQGSGTSAYRAYSRAHEISARGKTAAIAGSSNPLFRGDAARWNPAELLIAALSTCHQLWYLHLCADAGVVVIAYSDRASGVEIEEADGAGQFESVTLRPHTKLAAGSDENIARHLHDAAAEKCFIARSVSFKVEHEPTFEIAST